MELHLSLLDISINDARIAQNGLQSWYGLYVKSCMYTLQLIAALIGAVANFATNIKRRDLRASRGDSTNRGREPNHTCAPRCMCTLERI